MIKSIRCVTTKGVGNIYYVGDNDVAEINDHSIEWENHIDWYYEIKDKNGNLIAEIINCPVEITYKK